MEPTAGSRRNQAELLIQRRHPRKTRAGFTLMELMVVLVIIGIITGVIVSEMRGSLEDALLRSSSRKLIDLLNVTYSHAVTQGQVHRFRLDERTGKYIIEHTGEDSAPGFGFVPATDISGFSGQIDSRISIQIRPLPQNLPEGTDSVSEEELITPPLSEGISFYPDGTADGCAIVLRDRMGFEVDLEVNPVTADIRVREEHQP